MINDNIISRNEGHAAPEVRAAWIIQRRDMEYGNACRPPNNEVYRTAIRPLLFMVSDIGQLKVMLIYVYFHVRWLSGHLERRLTPQGMALLTSLPILTCFHRQ